MWPDVDKVPLFQNLPEQMNRLPRTKERFDASLFFLQEASGREGALDDPAATRHQAATWLTWAAIVSHCGADESLAIDVEEAGRPGIWSSSPERHAVGLNPLLAVLRELRNYAVHFEFHRSNLHPFKADWNGETKDLGPSAFFVAIDWPSFSRLRNLQRPIPTVTQDMVAWFNRQATQWPAINLLATANEQFATLIGTFAQRESL